MMEALATINPTSYSTNYFEAPPTQHIHMPQTESPQQSPQQTHVETHYQAHTPQQQHLYGFHNYSSTHLSSRPSMFATSSSTPLSAYDSQQYCRPTMPPTNIFHIQHTDDEVVVEDDDDEDESEDEDEEEEEEEQPQLVTCARGRISQRNEQQLRVQPPRRRKPPPCGTSSHRRR
ncbi:hypothetical protein Lal_00001249 [Lupinus albus]|nr:hypothetical protein Lal_00001249 [Lupinus albus]